MLSPNIGKSVAPKIKPIISIMIEINLKLFSPNINKIPKKIPIQDDLEFVKIVDIDIPKLKKYIPLSKRQDKPDSVLWILKNHPQLKDSQIAKLVGITKNSVVAIRNKSYWNYNSLNPKDPVAINLFSQKDLLDALEKAERRIKREKKEKEKAKPLATQGS